MDIEGLTYIENFLSAEEASELLAEIDKQEWQTSLKRRVQQYGPVYSYTTKKLEPELKSIPNWLKTVTNSVDQLKLFPEEPTQVIINEYVTGQGIARHIDSPLFGPVIASLSLCESAIMAFRQFQSSLGCSKELKPNSLIVLANEARFKWDHSIDPYVDKEPNVKNRRVSITLRTVLQMPQPTS